MTDIPFDSASEAHHASGSWITSATDETFETEVIERSHQIPVVVDFWASWCAPCRALGPVLEDLTREYGGRFVLVKVDTEQAPSASMQFQMQSIPAVFAVIGGQAVEFFEGALPPPQVRSWIDRVLVFSLAADAERLEKTDPAQAEAKYRQFIEQTPDQAAGYIGLARTLAAQGRQDEAREIIQSLEKRGYLEPEAEQIKAQLEIGRVSNDDLHQLETEARQQPENYDLQLRYAKGLAGDQRYQQAFEICLTLVENDRRRTGEEARKFMVELFHALGNSSELVREYQRQLMMALN